MELTCPKHNKQLIPLDKPSQPWPDAPANGQILVSELGKAYCEECDDIYTYACSTDGQPFLLQRTTE